MGWGGGGGGGGAGPPDPPLDSHIDQMLYIKSSIFTSGGHFVRENKCPTNKYSVKIVPMRRQAIKIIKLPLPGPMMVSMHIW